jgi:hypothetical protein
MDVELPNGFVIQDVPDGISQTELMTLAIRNGLAKPSDFGQMAPSAPTSGFAMGLKAPISGLAELLPRGLAAVSSLGGLNPNPVSRFLEQEAQRVTEMNRAEQAAYEAQRRERGQEGFDFPKLAGEVVSPANIVVAGRGAALARGLGGGAGTQAVAGGAAGGLAQPTTGLEGKTFTEEKLEQTGLGAIGGKIGQEVAKGAGRVLNPLVSKAEQTMRDLGITPTVGQTIGGSAKRLEEYAQDVPLIAESVRDARQRVIFQFNEGLINKTLGKIDEKLPARVIGRDAIAHASDAIDQKYTDVLSKMSFDLDFKTTSDIMKALNDAKLLSTQQRQEVTDVLNNIVLSKFSGQKLTGQEYKAIESDLRKKASNYMTSDRAADKEIGEALTSVLGVLKKELYSQNPKQTPQLRRVDSAYGDLMILQTAAANSGAPSGVFTPKQYSTAVRQADQTRRKSQFAKGRARGQQEADAAVEVLGEESGSTLLGRQTVGAAGGLGLLLTNPMLTSIITPALRAAYSEGGQEAIDRLLRSRPDLLRSAGGLLTGQQVGIGGAVGGLPISEYNIMERTPRPMQ